MNIELDESQLLALAGSDQSLLLPIVEDFSMDGLGLIDKMERARADGDIESYQACVHQLKGSSGSLGMMSVYESCVKLEQAGEEDVAEDCLSALREQLQGSVQLALSCLRG
ncbi:MAG: Hpt domain-containing protein [Verrucomicrobiae bacterium]|nr:Hpt domain-containing protein [Verrucomicrobiae bacterium]NNJ43597.1 Hpt domain-containing protein [Akkermansiaceae bacterium]